MAGSTGRGGTIDLDVAGALRVVNGGAISSSTAAAGDALPDQLSVEPVWETPTKPGRAAAGLGLVRHAATAAGEAAWFAIGGIDEANIDRVVAAGARRVVVVRALREAADPEAAARALRAALEREV